MGEKELPHENQFCGSWKGADELASGAGYSMPGVHDSRFCRPWGPPFPGHDGVAFPPWPTIFLGGARVSTLRWGSTDRGTSPNPKKPATVVLPAPSHPRFFPLCPKCGGRADFVDEAMELAVCHRCAEPFSFAWAKRAEREREHAVLDRLRQHLLAQSSKRARWAMRQQRRRDRRKRCACQTQEDVHGSRMA